MKISTILRRFLMPRTLITAICRARFGARVSPRAEVELSRNLRLGRGAQISSFTKIKTSGGLVAIGERTSIASGCMIGSDSGGISIGDDCLFGPHVTVVANSYVHVDIRRTMREQGTRSIGVRIGNDVLLGAGTVVLDGASVGDGVIAVPNTVISGEVPPRAIVQGSPMQTLLVRR